MEEKAREYNLTDADLMQLGDTAVYLMTRDAAELLLFGIDAVDVAFITDKTEEFKDFPSDEEMAGSVMVATETKNADGEALMTAMRAIMVRAQIAFGTTSAKYKSFGSKGMNKMNDNQIYRLGKRVVERATFYLAELAAEGLTQAIVDELSTLTIAFDDAIDAKEKAIIDRDIATSGRVELGNVLYGKIAKVFAAGRNYWISRNEAKYNDYVIYKSSGSSTKAAKAK